MLDWKGLHWYPDCTWILSKLQCHGLECLFKSINYPRLRPPPCPLTALFCPCEPLEVLCSFVLPAIQDAKSKFPRAAVGFAGFMFASGLVFCISSNSARASGSMLSRRYGMPTMITSEKRAMRIIGLLRKDRIETVVHFISLMLLMSCQR